MFMMLMNDVLRDYMDQFVVNFIDDMLVYSKVVAEHEIYLQTVFGKLQASALYANAQKTKLCKIRIEYLGHVD